MTSLPFGTHERDCFFVELGMYMQPLQKMMSHSKSSHYKSKEKLENLE